jgi:hypothetical protein
MDLFSAAEFFLAGAIPYQAQNHIILDANQ